jgi:twitching motility protein PilT
MGCYCYEIMIATTSIGALIRENKTYRIPSDIQTGAQIGMISLDAHLMSLVNRGMIEPNEALEKAQMPESMRDSMAAAGVQLQEA